MADLRITACQPGRPRVPVRPVPEQTRRTALAPAPRIVRQVEAVDAWIAARREREQALHAPSMSRDERMDVAREVDALRQTHDAIRVICARGLGVQTEPLRRPGPTAVLAHRHAWFVDTLALLLGERGVSVLVSTDNAADALGAVVAEQPDMVLVGDRLAMMPVDHLLPEIRRFAPDTLLTVAASDLQSAGAWRAQADEVFFRHQPPRDVADTLSALCSGTARASGSTA